MNFNLSNSSGYPACLDISSVRLDSMSVSELADAMEEAIDLMTEEDYDPAIIDAYLEAMDRKYPVPGDLITQTSYNDFTEKVQSLVSVRTSRPQHQFPKRFRHMLRASLAAALIALLVWNLSCRTGIWHRCTRRTRKLDRKRIWVWLSSE